MGDTIKKHTLASFSKYYNDIYNNADRICKEINLCKWEQNCDGTFSCIINRVNSEKHCSDYLETDGCCIELCKNPSEYSDDIIKKRQHNKKTGCTIKSIKCKLHFCAGLGKMAEKDENIKIALCKIENLRKMFSTQYEELWKTVPFGVSKSIYLEYFKKIYMKKIIEDKALQDASGS
jgi:hypothetical protein